MSSSPIQELKTLADYQSFIGAASHPDKVLKIAYFSAVWCPPCKLIKPYYAELAAAYTNVAFAKIDVDKNSEAAAEAGVTSMPTFIFFKGGNRMGQVQGANKDALLQLVKQYGGVALDGEGPSSSTGPANPNIPLGQSDVTSLINKQQVDCLNQQEKHSVNNIFEKGDGFLESDVDEQLMISIPFNQNIKLHSIEFIVPEEDIDYAPKTIKTFVNRTSTPSFEEGESGAETEELIVLPNKVIPLKYVRYQHVVQVAVFVIDNQGGRDTTRIQGLKCYGTPLETPKIEDWSAGPPE